MSLLHHHMSEVEKLEWLRKYVDPVLPDIYNTPGFKPNGCGPQGKRILSYIIPDDLPFMPCFEVAGDYHDWGYHVGGSGIDRARVDETLHWIMMELAIQSIKWWNPISWFAPLIMRPTADAYYMMVRRFGGFYFGNPTIPQSQGK